MDTTLNPNQTHPHHVLGGRADEVLVRAYEQITRADEQIARTEEQLSRLERDAARHPSDDPPTRRSNFRPAIPPNRPRGGRAIRGFIGLLLAAFIGVAAIAWQSPYGDAVRPLIARWAPQLAATSPAVQAVAKPAPLLPAPPVQTASQDAAPTVAALPPELTQLLQTMARDLATVGQQIDQLKAGQEQIARDNANVAEQLKTSQEQMARVIAKASEQNLRPKVVASPPRPTANPALPSATTAAMPA
jgi:hypothetical protein